MMATSTISNKIKSMFDSDTEEIKISKILDSIFMMEELTVEDVEFSIDKRLNNLESYVKENYSKEYRSIINNNEYFSLAFTIYIFYSNREKGKKILTNYILENDRIVRTLEMQFYKGFIPYWINKHGDKLVYSNLDKINKYYNYT